MKQAARKRPCWGFQMGTQAPAPSLNTIAILKNFVNRPILMLVSQQRDKQKRHH